MVGLPLVWIVYVCRADGAVHFQKTIVRTPSQHFRTLAWKKFSGCWQLSRCFFLFLYCRKHFECVSILGSWVSIFFFNLTSRRGYQVQPVRLPPTDFVLHFSSDFRKSHFIRSQVCRVELKKSAVERPDPGASNGGSNVEIGLLGAVLNRYEMVEMLQNLKNSRELFPFFLEAQPFRKYPDRSLLFGFRRLGSVLSSALWTSRSTRLKAYTT